MRSRWTAVWLGAATLFAAREAAGETPRATHLLRAEKLAEQAARRLRLPERRAPGWRQGGTGFGSEPAPPPSRGGSVVIRVPPARRSAQE
jgi:hypothetical protein